MFFFSSRRRHTRFSRDWSSDVCSSDLTSVSWQFFLFCQETLVEEGFFLHKYTPYGQPVSSWLPWVDSHGGRTLPVQEDETGLVLWSLWEHYRTHRNIDFVVGLYSTLIVPAADWTVSYVDDIIGLTLPSVDLWWGW